MVPSLDATLLSDIGSGVSPFVAGNGKIAQLIFLAAHFGFFVKLVARDASGGGAEEAVFI